MTNPIVKFRKIVPEAVIPKYAKPGDAGMDLSCVCAEEVYLRCGNRICLGTGLQVEIPPGYEGQIRSRSGWAIKEGLAVLNSPATLDSGFRGEIKVILINHGDRFVPINTGDRIAQLVISPVASAEIVEVEELSTTERGTDGLGSTGK